MRCLQQKSRYRGVADGLRDHSINFEKHKVGLSMRHLGSKLNFNERSLRFTAQVYIF